YTDTATTEISTLSLHDALPICAIVRRRFLADRNRPPLSGEDGRGEPCDRKAEDACGGLYARQRSERRQGALIKLQLQLLVFVSRSEEHTSGTPVTDQYRMPSSA